MALPSPRPQTAWPNAARREQREEGREKRADSSIRCIFNVPRGHVEKVLKISRHTVIKFQFFYFLFELRLSDSPWHKPSLHATAHRKSFEGHDPVLIRLESYFSSEF